ncbi:MAG: hypothetical protein VB122_06510 [Erysipelotrichales bacterium]|nr:hypothetical protein [Erysipelotrichales bacterium]
MLGFCIKYRGFPFLFLFLPNSMIKSLMKDKKEIGNHKLEITNPSKNELIAIIDEIPRGLIADVNINNWSFVVRKM